MSSSNCLLSLQTFLHHSTLDSAASRHKPDRTQKENKTRQDIDKTETIQGPLWIIMSRCPGKRTLAPTDSCSIFETGQAPAPADKKNPTSRRSVDKKVYDWQYGETEGDTDWGLTMWRCVVATGQLPHPALGNSPSVHNYRINDRAPPRLKP